MKLYSIETRNFKLDGGAMFGVVPKTIWNKTNPADAQNLVDIAARSLLVEDGKRLILIDTGMGDKQSDKFFGYYSLWGPHTLDKSLANHGFCREDITDVFLSHLHFDHCGGCIKWNKDKTGYEPAFKNAKFWTNTLHWKWATQPNAREKASFLTENLLPMEESGQLNFIEIDTNSKQIQTNFDFEILFVDGHTEKLMIPQIKFKDKTICFVSDLLPTVGHIPLAYIPSYDTRPLLTLEEKEQFLNIAATQNLYLFLQHDAHTEIITVTQTDRGIRLKERFSCSDIF